MASDAPAAAAEAGVAACEQQHASEWQDSEVSAATAALAAAAAEAGQAAKRQWRCVKNILWVGW